jgi:hypothetical protein
MLENLDDIDWAALGELRIPTLLREMQSEDKKAFGVAIRELQEIITPERVLSGDYPNEIVQMMRSELPARVTPFLVEMLSHESDGGKQVCLLEVLHSLGAYWFLINWFSENSPNRKSYEQWARRINDAVREGMPIYQKLLDDPIPQVRASAQEVLDILEETRSE